MIGRYDSPRERELGWTVRALVAGFGAAVVMSLVLVIAYGVALLLGSDDPAAPVLARWFWGLTHNALTAQTQSALPVAILLHLLAGLAWAILYAGFVEPRLSGPGWQRGLIFAPLPWALSLVVFLPAVGGGFLGLSLGAGPLPIVGNFILHLVYGFTLGTFYALESNQPLVGEGGAASSEESSLQAEAAGTMALGIVIGLIAGGLVGWIGATLFAPASSGLVGLLFGALAGSAVGLLIGSFAGLSVDTDNGLR